MADEIEVFKEQYPSLESYWRSVVLFGRNVASYKFALAESLLEIAPTGKTEIDLEELADPYSRHLCRHLASSPRQTTSLRPNASRKRMKRAKRIKTRLSEKNLPKSITL